VIPAGKRQIWRSDLSDFASAFFSPFGRVFSSSRDLQFRAGKTEPTTVIGARTTSPTNALLMLQVNEWLAAAPEINQKIRLSGK
jgi:hypothetical protein